MKHLLWLALLGGCLSQAWAADPVPGEAPAAATEPGSAETRPQQDAPRPRAAERFEPSEQISEDLSVSFPADI